MRERDIKSSNVRDIERSAIVDVEVSSSSSVRWVWSWGMEIGGARVVIACVVMGEIGGGGRSWLDGSRWQVSREALWLRCACERWREREQMMMLAAGGLTLSTAKWRLDDWWWWTHGRPHNDDSNCMNEWWMIGWALNWMNGLIGWIDRIGLDWKGQGLWTVE